MVAIFIKMNSKELEDFYRRWLLVNHPAQVQVPLPAAAQPIQDENSLQNIVFENDKFQLYIEKGK